MAKGALRLLAIGAAYFLANKAALFFPDAESVLTAVWPAAGIGLAALLLSPRRLWPGIALAIFLAGNLANLVSGRPLVNSLGFMAANVLESLGSAWLMTRLCGGGVRFARTREVLALLLAALGVNAATALAGAGTAALAGLSPFWEFWETWYVADGLGMFLVAPLLVAWLGPRNGDARLVSPRWAESAAFLALWTYDSLASLAPQSPSTLFTPQPYLLVALLAWPALRLGLRTLTLALALLAAIAVLHSRLGATALFPGSVDPTDQLLMVQVFVGSVAAAGYFLFAAFAERRAAEAALRQEQVRLAGIIEGTNVGTWEWNVATGETVFNEKWAQIVGYSLAELAPVSIQTWIDLAHPDDIAASSEQLRRHFSGELPYYDCECRMRHRDGHWAWVHDRGRVVSRTAGGEPLLMLGTHQDITARKQAEFALQVSEERLRRIFDQAPVGIFQAGRDGRFQYVNRKMCDIVGYAREELTGLDIRDLTYPEDLEAERERLQALFAGRGGPVTSQKRYIRKDGSLVWANRTAAPVHDGSGELSYVIGIVEDITEKRQAEQFREDVERIIRHDLKTPLAGVISIPRLLLDDANLTAEQRSLLELVSASGRRMLHQINASLELYKIESGIYRFAPRACDPAQLAQESAALLCTIMDADPGRFRIRDATGLGPGTALRTDPLLLDMVLMNLLRNALEASDPGSPVGIDLSVQGRSYVIAVSNSRPVPAEVRDRFFDRFATAGKPGGTGLGTYSAALMVRAVGGDIAMATSDAEGTTVTVRLPLDA